MCKLKSPLPAALGPASWPGPARDIHGFKGRRLLNPYVTILLGYFSKGVSRDRSRITKVMRHGRSFTL